ncbi:MAG: hypothetical protein IJN50_01780 [Clostridia bacterium]|nr:hypothetical protein [Clostridia bacterium]
MKTAAEIRALIDADNKKKLAKDLKKFISTVKDTVKKMYDEEKSSYPLPFTPSHEKFIDSDCFRDCMKDTGFWAGDKNKNGEWSIIIYELSDNKKFGYSSTEITEKIKKTKETNEENCKKWFMGELETATEEMAKFHLEGSWPFYFPQEYRSCTELISSIAKEYGFDVEFDKTELFIKI